VSNTTLEHAELAASRYRAVVAMDVIEHLLDPAAALTTLRAALEDGGVLFLATPDAGSGLARLLGRRWWSVLPMHVQYFTRGSLTTLLARSGFVVEDVSTHAKAFSVGYYADRLAAFTPIGGNLAPAVTRRLGSDRIIAPDFGDRMAVIARKA
jgi:hypothetical protein